MREFLGTNSKVNNFIFVTLLIAHLGVLFFKIAYLESTFVCGKIIGRSKVKGINYVNYSFVVNGETYFNSISRYDLKNEITIDSLEKVNCIQIEYSFISKSINRFADNRFLID